MQLFVATIPGLEHLTAAELRELGADAPRATPGGVELEGGLEWVYRVNLRARTASRLLVRLAQFPARHLGQLAKRAREIDWGAYVTADAPLAVRATCRRSRIYHSGAAEERVRDAIIAASRRAPPLAGRRDPDAEEAAAPTTTILVRIDEDVCTISVDSSGPHLHRRGYKLDAAKAPLRETMAAALLRYCGWDGTTPLLDPMCGSGTFAIEAALLAAGIPPGAHRDFAFMLWPSHDAAVWEAERRRAVPTPRAIPPILASDRDGGAVAAAQRNAERAGVAHLVCIEQRPLSAARPRGARGLLVCNPPYGQRIGEVARLRDLYAALGNSARAHFSSWSVAILTSDSRLAQAAGLRFDDTSPPLPHGGLKVRLYVHRPQAELIAPG